MTQYGLLVSTEEWRTMLSEAQQAETLGFHSIWVDDHLLPFNHKNPENRLEAWTSLTALATSTLKIRLGNLVLCNSFRNPALVGKMIASLDNISSGRLEVGLGAGWFEEEYKAFGYDFHKPGSRIKQLQESLDILELVFSGQKFDYTGSNWTLEDCQSLPRPIQSPMPIWIGGTGSKMVHLAVDKASGLNITSSAPEEFEKIMNRVTETCDELGKKKSNFKTSYMTFVHFTKDMEEREKVIDYLHETWYPQPPREAFETLLVGPIELVKEKASYYLENYDLNLFIGKVKGTESIDNPIALFHDEILNSFT